MKNPWTYTFNENGVCTNPTVILQKETKQYAVQLNVCQLPNGKWVGGYLFGVRFGNYGCCSGGDSIHSEPFETMEAASKAVTNYYLKRIQEMIQSAHDWNRRQKEYVDQREERNNARQKKPQPVQTALF